jgi:TRAP-type C4-dicarboxylate transport system permease large subunit
MLFFIIAASQAFSQLLAYSGAASGLAKQALGLPVLPIIIMILMQLIVFILGMLMDPSSIMMVTLPLYMPIVHLLGFNDIWFAAIFLLNIEISLISPPFGLSLFVMKAVSSSDVSMIDIYRAGLPFIAIQVFLMALMFVFPIISLWLPSLMR